jgi:transposase
MQITTIGLDIAKNVFQVHGINASEKVVVRKQVRRSQVLEFFKALPPCLVGMEARATAHYWAREHTKLGHQVRLMPAKDVKAYVKRNKNDAADAEAICEAVRRPSHPTCDPYADHAKSGGVGWPAEPLRATRPPQGDHAPPGREWIIGKGNRSDFRTPHPQGDRAVHGGGRSSQVVESCNSQARGRQNANASV